MAVIPTPSVIDYWVKSSLIFWSENPGRRLLDK
jgi:hypothetical protein